MAPSLSFRAASYSSRRDGARNWPMVNCTADYSPAPPPNHNSPAALGRPQPCAVVGGEWAWNVGMRGEAGCGCGWSFDACERCAGCNHRPFYWPAAGQPLAPGSPPVAPGCDSQTTSQPDWTAGLTPWLLVVRVPPFAVCCHSHATRHATTQAARVMDSALTLPPSDGLVATLACAPHVPCRCSRSLQQSCPPRPLAAPHPAQSRPAKPLRAFSCCS